MTQVPIDVSKVPPPRDTAPPHNWRNGADPTSDPDPGSFAARVEARRVDLVALVKEGIPPRQYHACSAGMLVKGKRHLWAAPHKSGKSLVALVHGSRMALAGERVAIFDRENGADLYCERLAAIMEAWQLSDAERETIRRNLPYYEFPQLKRDDAADLVRYLTGDQAADLVVFDSQRMFLTDFGLAEAVSDDYSRFMAYAIDPLHRAGISTLILDNTGHDGKHARGSSSKLDLNEQLFSLKEVIPFDRHQRGTVELVLERSRFGDRGSWRMPIGGGVFGVWEPDSERVQKVSVAKPKIQPAVYEALRAAGGQAMGLHKLLRQVRETGAVISNSDGQKLLRQWAADPEEPLQHDAKRGYWIDV